MPPTPVRLSDGKEGKALTIVGRVVSIRGQGRKRRRFNALRAAMGAWERREAFWNSPRARVYEG